MNELHLFAGIGGGILGGILLGHTTVCAVELDPYCRQVLKRRQLEGCLPQFPIYEDVRQFDGKPWRGKVDVVCGGFPCQPWSQAGKRKGKDDPRHLWPEMARIISECRPRFVFAENVSLAAFEEPWRDLRGLGYRVPPALCLGASHVGAPHRRLRWWMLASDANRKQHEGGAYAIGRAGAEELPAVPDANGCGMHQQHAAQHQPRTGGSLSAVGSDGGEGAMADAASLGRSEGWTEPAREQGRLGAAGGGSPMADSSSPRLEGRSPPIGVRAQHARSSGSGWWATEPPLGRVAHGIPNRVGQLRALGNAQVPQVAAAAFIELMGRLA